MTSIIPDRSHISTEGLHPDGSLLDSTDPAVIVDALIRDQEAVLQALIQAGPAITQFISACKDGFLAGGRLITLGAGTSGRLAVLDASEIPPTFCMPEGRIIGIIAGGDTSLRRSSEGKEDDPAGSLKELDALHLNSNDAVLGIAAGGTTPYVLGALEAVKKLANPPITGLLTCAKVPRPPACDHLLYLPTGPELLSGSTRLKAGTATKIALNTISTTLMALLGKTHGGLMVDVKASNVKLRDRAARIISRLAPCTRDQAFALLDAAGGSVKTAIIMHWHKCDKPQAEIILAKQDHRLKPRNS